MYGLTDEQEARVEQKLEGIKANRYYNSDTAESWREFCLSQVLVADFTDLEQGYYAGLIEGFCWENGLHEDGFSTHRLHRLMGESVNVKFDMRKFVAAFSDMDDEGRIFILGFHVDHEDFFLDLWTSEARDSNDADLNGNPKFGYPTAVLVAAFEGMNL